MESHPNDCLYYLVTRVSLSLTSALRSSFTAAGYDDVKPAYIGVLLQLWMDDGMGSMLGKFGTEEGIKIIELGKLAGLEPSSMTGLIDRMERDGLVVRTSDPNDRRASIVQLTRRGVDIRTPLLAIITDTIGAFTAHIPPKQMTTAKNVLKMILEIAHRG